MDKTEFKQNLVDLLKEYFAYCDTQSKEFKKKNKFDAPVAPTLDGFAEWLETGEDK